MVASTLPDRHRRDDVNDDSLNPPHKRYFAASAASSSATTKGQNGLQELDGFVVDDRLGHGLLKELPATLTPRHAVEDLRVSCHRTRT